MKSKTLLSRLVKIAVAGVGFVACVAHPLSAAQFVAAPSPASPLAAEKWSEIFQTVVGNPEGFPRIAESMP